MNITFFIGNGFDLNFGLKTRFSDFLDYHKRQNFTDALSKAIEKDTPLWSDLEYTLGQSVANLSMADVETFIQNKGNLDNSLIQYLSEINTAYKVGIMAGSREEFMEKVTTFFTEFREIEREKFLHYRNGINGAIQYRFISFNYTTFLDRIIAEAKSLPAFGQHVYSPTKTQYHDALWAPIHIHGGLFSDMLLGVNDVSQLKCPPNIAAALAPYMIKPNMNDFLGDQKILHTKEIIDNSNYVLVFGMSHGLTDLIWWQYLYEWLKRSKNNRLVLYEHSDDLNLASGTVYSRFVNSRKQAFIEIAKTDEDFEQVANQIIILPNSSIFTFTKIKVEKGHDKS